MPYNYYWHTEASTIHILEARSRLGIRGGNAAYRHLET